MSKDRQYVTPGQPDVSDIANAAYWLRTAADYITTLHERLGIKSTSYADGLRIEAYVLDADQRPASLDIEYVVTVNDPYVTIIGRPKAPE